MPYRVLDRTQRRCPLESTTVRLETKHLFKARQGPVLGPVCIEFQAPFETVYPGGGAYLASGFGFIFFLKPVVGNRCLKPPGCTGGTVEIDRMGNWLSSYHSVANDGRQASGLQVFFV
jgi:hypothetical protein